MSPSNRRGQRGSRGSSERARARRRIGAGGVLVLALAAGAAHAIWPFDRDRGDRDLAQTAASLLSEAIQLRTVNPPGDEARLARRLAEVLTDNGIESRLIPTPSVEGGPERAAVWGRLPGGDRPALLLLSHLDTVPADASEWSADPFGGEIRDGFVWGRGALDAKGVAVTHLLTLVELARSGQPLDRDVIFLATPDEETGGLDGAGFLAREQPRLFDGVGYLLTEGGGIQANAGTENERPEIWGITLTEKAPCWLELRARGRAGHSSSPTPDAAVPRLIAALDRIRRVESPIKVSDEVAEMFRRLAPIAPEWDREAFSDLAGALERDDAFRRRFLDNPGQNALVRNTVSITVLEGAPKTNVAPPIARAHLDARLLPGERCEDFARSIGKLIDEPEIEIEELLSFPARASSADSPLYRAIESVAARHSPEALVVPRMIGGFTDAHWFRELGIVSYGFVPRAVSATEASRVHGIDERVRIETLGRSIARMVEIARSLDVAERGF